MRLTYNTNDNGTWTTRRNVVGNETEYSVTINTDYSFALTDLTTTDTVFKGTAFSLIEAKKSVREAFKTLGVDLGTETRTRAAKTLDLAAKVV